MKSKVKSKTVVNSRERQQLQVPVEKQESPTAVETGAGDQAVKFPQNYEKKKSIC